MCRVCGENFMRNGVMREWCRKFKDGRTVVHDEERHDMTPPHTPGAYNLKDYLTSWVCAGWTRTTNSTTGSWEPTRMPYPE
ncbi:hypothetical protein AVEN_167418-1 [Araneus ventricosus]|uniref:Mos1 transposase HTH domain-containing protein n=1 Tax=Araneus ventricosus TaxID=182803 RepID=A0A4Y2K8U3_ARAVE|nr:hypothetical protein AVEN_167418-1 [Araneus ventricosus]